MIATFVPANAIPTGLQKNWPIAKAVQRLISLPFVFIGEKNLLSVVREASVIFSFRIATCSVSIARITR
jgi:hypothetical protein